MSSLSNFNLGLAGIFPRTPMSALPYLGVLCCCDWNFGRSFHIESIGLGLGGRVSFGLARLLNTTVRRPRSMPWPRLAWLTSPWTTSRRRPKECSCSALSNIISYCFLLEKFKKTNFSYHAHTSTHELLHGTLMCYHSSSSVRSQLDTQSTLKEHL